MHHRQRFGHLSHVAEDDDALQRVLPRRRRSTERVGLAPHDGPVLQLVPNLVVVPEITHKCPTDGGHVVTRWQQLVCL